MILFTVFAIGMMLIIDLVTTENKYASGAVELNPLMGWLFEKYGMHNIMVSKMMLIILLSIVLSKVFPVALIAFAGFYGMKLLFKTKIMRTILRLDSAPTPTAILVRKQHEN